MKGHPHSWLRGPQLVGLPGIDGYTAELGLATELPAAIAQYRGHWIEYGVAGRAYALQCPGDFNGPRADSAIEYKHQNVGAIMIESGFACIRGYKPTGNFQDALSNPTIFRS